MYSSNLEYSVSSWLRAAARSLWSYGRGRPSSGRVSEKGRRFIIASDGHHVRETKMYLAGLVEGRGWVAREPGSLTGGPGSRLRAG